MKTKNKIVEEFGTGWKHFCACINFESSSLDAEAICFMNEMPNRICSSHNDLLNVCADMLNALKNTNPDAGDNVRAAEIEMQVIVTKAKGNK